MNTFVISCPVKQQPPSYQLPQLLLPRGPSVPAGWPAASGADTVGGCRVKPKGCSIAAGAGALGCT